MKNGALIFAHNSREVDYALHAVIAGGLVVKHLNVPVSLVTDSSTLKWMEESGIHATALHVFENIIEVEKPVTGNVRNLYDGLTKKSVPFVNSNRSSAWDLTPYDRTLLIDSDFLIFSNRLSEYWQAEGDILISQAMNDVCDISRAGYHDRYVSDTGIHLLWATNVIFTKNERSKAFFNMVDYIRKNYQYYADLFRFNPRQFRNDIAFSVAKHILDGFETDLVRTLPPVLTTMDRDILYKVDENEKMTFLVSPRLDHNFCAVGIKGMDVHVMNKDSITRNADSLLRLI